MSSESVETIISLAFLLLLFVFFFLCFRTRSHLQKALKELKALKKRFQPVLDIESEVKKVREEHDLTMKQTILDIENKIEKIREEHDLTMEEIRELRRSYAQKKEIYDKLLKEVAIYEEQIAFAQYGVYSPHFDFTDSDQFKTQIETVRAKQKEMISDKTAVQAFTDWEVSGNKREGKKMTNRAIKLSLRSFNNECEAAFSNARWNNVNAMEKRIFRAHEQIDKLNEVLNITINQDYLDLKYDELWLTHEYREKQKEERDYKRENARMKREEERLLRDAAIAMKEEAKYQKLLKKAKEEAAKAVGVDAKQYEARIAQLSKELEEAHKKVEKAKSMAEQTRAGYIYVVSNIGSFGEGVYKIGMTRRLEPMERVRELGDASVPFLFDTHAMIYCEDAPVVEKTLHSTFEKHRVNRANNRKEFFRVSLEDIVTELQKISPNADIITGIEAQEYYETLAMNTVDQQEANEKPEEFPTNI